MIEVDRLTRRYGGFTAVDNVSFTIAKGEVIGLLGHNGAGKTTIMKMLTGYLEPTAGRIVIGGVELGADDRDGRRVAQARIGYLPENCPVWPEMTVIDYLDYQAALHGVAEAERPLAIARAIRRTALKEKATHAIQTLSRGYRQRVGVAQAILHRPQIVILDEPTNGLDPTQIRHMRELIRELAREATVIVSTHILQEVQAVCERVLILRGGRLALDARLDELHRSERLLATLDRDDPALLRGIEGVTAVEPLGTAAGRHHFALAVSDGETAPTVAAAVTAAGARLYALEPERHDLERLFARINESGEIKEVAHG